MKNYKIRNAMKKIMTIMLVLSVMMSGVMVGVGGVMADEVENETASATNAGETVNDDGVLNVENEETKEDAIFIKAVNPGYKINGVSNVGEMIEIARKDKSSNTPILLAGYKIDYTNSSRNTSMLVEFPEHTYLAGEKILLRLASSPSSGLAALRYKTTLGTDGGISLVRGETIVDSVCWTGKDGCQKKFNTSKPTALVRNEETWEFEHLEEYAPEYVADAYLEEANEGYGSASGEEGGSVSAGDGSDGDAIAAKCKGVVFSEILSYYVETKMEQFIEFYNSGTETIVLDGCAVRYKNKDYFLRGQIRAEEYLAWYLTEFNLTKNPTNTNMIELIDANDEVIDRLEYPNGQRKGTAWAFIGYDGSGKEIWRTTYAVTPGEANIYQEYKSCEEGKVINEETGNCVKSTEVAEKTCEAGQYLNPLTGRCKKIEEEEEKECAEGYELNLETGRCRKIKENTGADYELKQEDYKESSSFVALYAVLGVVVVGVIYVGWEYRMEIKRLLRKIAGKIKK